MLSFLVGLVLAALVAAFGVRILVFWLKGRTATPPSGFSEALRNAFRIRAPVWLRRKALSLIIILVFGAILLIAARRYPVAQAAVKIAEHFLISLLVLAVLAAGFIGWWAWYRWRQSRKLDRRVGWLEALKLFYKGIPRISVSGPARVYLIVGSIISLVIIGVVMIIPVGLPVRLLAAVAYLILLVGSLDSMAKSDYGLTIVYEASFKVVEREKRFRWILWAYRGRTHITSIASARLNGLMFLLSLGYTPTDAKRRRRAAPKRSHKWLSENLKKAIKIDVLVTSWLDDDPSDKPLDEPDARELAESFMKWEKTRLEIEMTDDASCTIARKRKVSDDDVMMVLEGFEMVEGYVERFNKHDLMTLDELQEETALSTDLRLPAHLILWATVEGDCPPFERPRLKLLGGIQVIGVPGFDVIRPMYELGEWTTDEAGKPKCATRKKRSDLPLSRVRLQIRIPKAETLSGPAVASDFVVFGRIRNPYMAIYEIDDWEYATVQLLLDFMRSLFRKLSFEAAYGNKGLISATVSRCAKGEPVTIEMGKDSKKIHRAKIVKAEPDTIQSLKSLRKYGFVIDDMAIIDINPAKTGDEEYLRMEYEARRRGEKLTITATAEAEAIRQRGEAYRAQGDLAAAMVQQDTLKALPGGSVVIIGSSPDSVLTAELLGRKKPKSKGDDKEDEPKPAESGTGKKS